MQGQTYTRDELHQLPRLPGIYYLLDDSQSIIYIGKTVNPRERVRAHLFGKPSDGRHRKIQKRTRFVRFVPTGSELVALLYESDEIKKFLPMMNRAQRRKRNRVAVCVMNNRHGFPELKVTPLHESRGPLVRTFFGQGQARKWLKEMELQHRLCDSPGAGTPCFSRQIRRCDGACTGDVSLEEYRRRVRGLRDRKLATCTLIFEPGPLENELAFVYLRGGIYQGYGVISKAPVLRVNEVLKQLTVKWDSPDVQRILRRYFKSSERKGVTQVREFSDDVIDEELTLSV